MLSCPWSQFSTRSVERQEHPLTPISSTVFRKNSSVAPFRTHSNKSVLRSPLQKLRLKATIETKVVRPRHERSQRRQKNLPGTQSNFSHPAQQEDAAVAGIHSPVLKKSPRPPRPRW